ncbi:MAG: hypothetical protein NTZ30_12130, partial [Planctomycetota bacterium]|nr:hypothetical protein [Planctomycetota bacterium]
MNPKATRRNFLKATGVTLALPWLEAFAQNPAAGIPRRMVCICTPLSLHPANFFPKEAGKNYTPSP